VDEVEFLGEDPGILGVVDDEAAVWGKVGWLDGGEVGSYDRAVGVEVSCFDRVRRGRLIAWSYGIRGVARTEFDGPYSSP
jgi:hypothetical protein